MPNGDTLTLRMPQRRVKIAVEFYNDAEKEKLLSYANHEKIEEIVKSGLEVTTEEFLTYYLFHKKRPGKVGWRNHREIGRKIGNALAELDEWVDFNGKSISTPADVAGQDRAITERIGESVGLSVISHLHGLTAADWDRIPTSDHRTFDYQIASDGHQIVQMEAKGSATADNSVKTSSVSQHKRSILDKKKEIDALEKQRKYRFPADLRYGTITVMGGSGSQVRCLLVDPPADGDGTAAEGLRLLQRVRFLRDWISFISPRSQLASALQTRLAALEHLPDPLSLDGVPLRKGNGEEFDFTPIGGILRGHASFFTTKSKITDSQAGGIVVPLPTGHLFFLGIRETLLEEAAKQQMHSIMSYKAESGPLRKKVECVMTQKAFDAMRFPPPNIERTSEEGSYYRFELPGLIHYSDSGILYGVLPTHEDE
jgi:hypothetical protein